MGAGLISGIGQMFSAYYAKSILKLQIKAQKNAFNHRHKMQKLKVQDEHDMINDQLAMQSEMKETNRKIANQKVKTAKDEANLEVAQAEHTEYKNYLKSIKQRKLSIAQFINDSRTTYDYGWVAA